MHGQKRLEYKSRLLHPETSSKLATKAQQWNHLSYELVTQRRRLLSGVGPTTATTDHVAAQADIGIDDDGGGGGVASAAKPSPGILLSLTEKMLSVNPDPSHLWNIRRELLLHLHGPNGGEDTPDADAAIDDRRSSRFSGRDHLAPIQIQEELKLTALCLQRNPKAYSTWHHRKWSIAHHLTRPPPINDESIISSSLTMTNDNHVRHLIRVKQLLQLELELCVQFLQLDERNFHCWNYRRFVVALLGSCGGKGGGTETARVMAITSEASYHLFSGSWSSWLNSQSQVSMGAQLLPSANASLAMGKHDIANSISLLSKEERDEIIITEWNFTNSKIQDNFSNGSAFHYRSKLLPLVLECRLPYSHRGDGDTSPIPAVAAAVRYKESLTLAREEWENILLNAIFTEPDDQTPWWYHRFIVSWVKPPTAEDVGDDMKKEYETLLLEMADSLRELLELEKENDDTLGSTAIDRDESKGAKCKWAYIGLHMVLSMLVETIYMESRDAAELRVEAEECLNELMKIDPNRRERYLQLLTVELIRE